MENILYTLIITTILLLIGLIGMSFKVLFTKNGRFPNTHVGGNKALKNKGINCATSQDREARKNIL